MRSCLLVLCLGLPAVADAPKWDVTRTTAPDSVDELKALQSQVKKMVDRTTPSVVAIFYEVGAGSGVIISEDGLVLTAAHVVSRSPLSGFGRRNNPDAAPPAKESNKVSIQLPDGKRVSGVVLGRNRSMDSAMLQITDPPPKTATWPGAKEGKWPAVDLGKSMQLKKGQWVVSLGHPGGPKPERRPPVRLGQVVDFGGGGGPEKAKRIYTDCTLVGGDSGGPLFDLDGKLLGIHSSIGNDLAQNLHVPLHQYEAEWDKLKNVGGYLGLELAGDTDEQRKTAVPLIEKVKEKSPAETVGLKAGDVIVEYNGEKVKTSADIDNKMMLTRANETVLVKVKRGSDFYEFEIVLGKRPTANPQEAPK